MLYDTEIFTDATAIRPPGGIAYTGLGKAGWNATTFATVKAQISGLVKAADSGFFYDKHVTFHGTAHPKDYLTAKVPRRLIPRAAVGDVVVVPLDGVTVSWINDFNGLTATTAAPADLVPSKFLTLPVLEFKIDIPQSSPALQPGSLPRFPQQAPSLRIP